MSNNIIFNIKNIDKHNSANNKLVYDFGRSVEFSEDDTVSLAHMSVYLSWFNITEKYNNNKFFYKWWDTDGNLTVSVEIIIQDGFYTTETLYEYLVAEMVKKGHILVSADGTQYISLIKITSNATYYSSEIVLNAIGPNVDYGDGEKVYTEYCQAPDENIWKVPGELETPQVIFPATSNFKDLLGFTSQTIYGDTSNKDYQFSFLSDTLPNLMPSSSYIILCNLVDNELSNPKNVLHAFTIPNNTGFGDLIDISADIVYSKIKPGQYREIELVILDQNYNPLQIKDTNMLIQLSIQKKNK
jgi:hypothetical protein